MDRLSTIEKAKRLLFTGDCLSGTEACDVGRQAHRRAVRSSEACGYGAVPSKYFPASVVASMPTVLPVLRPAKSSALMWMPPQMRD